MLAEQPLDPLRLLRRHRPAASDDPREVRPQPVGDDPAVRAVAHRTVELGIRQDGLRRDAAPVAAHPSRALLLDDHRPQSELRGTDGRDVSPGPRADDDEIQRAHRAP
jgi:hypothetical protein